jgi:TetR/AcrR family transcriptional regulator
MSPDPDRSTASPAPATESKPATRVRPKPGERRLQILQMLAMMLQEPGGERVTTAALAARLDVSEAALYRHFASKAQMFEGLIEFIEQSLFGLINQIVAQEPDARRQLRSIVQMLTRVLIGDALITEDGRLQTRINQMVDRIEVSLKQCYRSAIEQGLLVAETDAAGRANLMMSFVLGRWMRFAKSGFKRPPVDPLDQQIRLLIS